MIVFWELSAEGLGVIFMDSHIVTPIRMGSRLKGIPPSTKSVSGAARSCTQRKEWRRSSTVVWKAVYMPKKIGIWMRIGRQPASGLIPWSL